MRPILINGGGAIASYAPIVRSVATAMHQQQPVILIISKSIRFNIGDCRLPARIHSTSKNWGQQTRKQRQESSWRSSSLYDCFSKYFLEWENGNLVNKPVVSGAYDSQMIITAWSFSPLVSNRNQIILTQAILRYQYFSNLFCSTIYSFIPLYYCIMHSYIVRVY